MGFLDIKPDVHLHGGWIAGIISGFLGLIGLVSGTASKIVTRNYITKDTAEKKYSTKDDNKALERLLISKIDGLGTSMDRQFDLVIKVVERNGGKR
ncbi:MAG: hypothetical protein U9R60_17400 [Bacteroidota bacterium]|nr:hypothetical protein [Bacteroidota bacterium]